jgi:hypothetical protein
MRVHNPDRSPFKIPLQGRFRVPAPALDLDSNGLLKIRPDLRVFFIANAAHSFQIISASEGPRGDNPRRHHMPNSRHGC